MRLDGVSENHLEFKVLYNDFGPTNRQSFEYLKKTNGKFKFNYKMTAGPI